MRSELITVMLHSQSVAIDTFADDIGQCTNAYMYDYIGGVDCDEWDCLLAFKLFIQF